LELTFKVGAKAKQLGRFFLDVADMCNRRELENRGSSRSENFSECVKLSEFSSKMV
jgi:hypothetical protein